MSATDELVDLLTLDPIEVNLFRGVSPPDERFRIFGGQVVAQALSAAYKTIDHQICHSLQSYFIRPGDPAQPVLYQVERSRDGRTFATRRVIAIQKGEQIFNMACSFQNPEDGYDHQDPFPADVPHPDTLPTEEERLKIELAQAPEEMKRAWRWRPIEFRPVNPVNLFTPEPAPPQHFAWFRTKTAVSDDVALNQQLLAYASDYSLLGGALRPHGLSWYSNVQTASLDHIVWFHRPSNFSRWHLYAQDAPSASGARGFNRGAIYTEDGVLVASTAQEGLMRPRKPRTQRS